MEFPSLGENCQKKDCNQIDFLPLQCKCTMVFCHKHFNDHCLSGECELAPKPKELNYVNGFQLIYKCSFKSCRKGSLHEMQCKKCDKHYCIEHRFHPSCPEIDDETMAAKIEQFKAPRRQFQEANKFLQDRITENIRKALQSSAKLKTASKIHLMRIKQKAICSKSVPVYDRVYFAIKKPVDMQPKPVSIVTDEENIKCIESLTLDPDIKGTVAVFVSKKWSLGCTIDSICDTCNIRNDNNQMGDAKIRLFRQLDGYCVSHTRMDVEIAELLDKNILLEGDKLVIEYIDNKTLSNLEDNAHVFLN